MEIQQKVFDLMARTRGYLLDMTIKDAMEARVTDCYDHETAVKILREKTLPLEVAVTNDEKIVACIMEKTPLRSLMFLYNNAEGPNEPIYERTVWKIVELWEDIVARKNVI
jgi:hypothetical protein